MLNYSNGTLKFSGGLLNPIPGVGPTPGPTPVPTDEVTIGDQIWKTKNLAIDDGQGGIYTQTVNYGQGDVVEYYYTWDAAVRVAASISGWHLPTRAEWTTLVSTVGGGGYGNTLKSTYGWYNDANGTDDYGFAGFPAGYQNAGSFNYLGSRTYFWTATSYSASKAYYRSLYSDGTIYATSARVALGYSVRLIKDAT